MRRSIIGILAAALLVAGFWGVGQGYCADNESGETIFNSNCAACHGVSGTGNGPAAAAFSPPPMDFNRARFWQKMSNARIADTIQNGHGSMRPVNLSPEDIKAVISYMRSTFQP